MVITIVCGKTASRVQRCLWTTGLTSTPCFPPYAIDSSVQTPMFYLQLSNLCLSYQADEPTIASWFPLHFVHGSRHELATCFVVAEDEAEMVEVTTKASLFCGTTWLVTEEDWERTLRGF